jgi:hypothetical protein
VRCLALRADGLGLHLGRALTGAVDEAGVGAHGVEQAVDAGTRLFQPGGLGLGALRVESSALMAMSWASLRMRATTCENCCDSRCASLAAVPSASLPVAPTSRVRSPARSARS